MATGKDVVLMTHTGEDGDSSEYRHIPGTGTFHTLCGWCDCGGSETHYIKDIGEPNCPPCLDVVRKALQYKKFI